MSSQEQVEFEFYFKSELQESQWRYLCRYVRWFRRFHKHGICHSISFKYTSSATDLADVIVLVQDLTLVPQYTTSNKTIYYYTPHVESRTRQSKRHKSSPSFTSCFTRYVKPYSRLSRKTHLSTLSSPVSDSPCGKLIPCNVNCTWRSCALNQSRSGTTSTRLCEIVCSKHVTELPTRVHHTLISGGEHQLLPKCGFTHFHPPRAPKRTKN